MSEKTLKFIGNANELTSILRSQYLLAIAGGNLRKVSVNTLMAAINRDQAELLQEVAWGIPIKDETQTSPDWGGLVGNTAAFATYKAMCGRYLVKADGTAAKLHRSTSTIYADGTALDETKGSICTIAPALYLLVQTDPETLQTIAWMSMFPISDVILSTTADKKFLCAGSYPGSLDSGKLVSRSGVAFDTSSKTISAYWSAAQSFGTHWGNQDYVFQTWFDLMCLCEAGAHTNIQDKLGMGPGGSAISWDTFNASSDLKQTGRTKSLGDVTGKVMMTGITGAVSDSSQVSVLGIEGKWNRQWEFIQGVFCGNSGNDAQDGTEVFIYQGNRMPSAAELSTHPSGEYRSFTRLTSGGYISKLLKGAHFDIFPSAVAGGTSSGYCDNSYANATGQVVRVGGYSDIGADAGPFYVNSGSAWSYSDSSFGARPAYYGNLTFVNGADIS